VAVNCCGIPSAVVAFEGTSSIETSVAVLTVKLVLEKMPEAGWVAVIVVLPVEDVEARPLVTAALLILATLGLEEAQVTAAVKSCVVASEYVPVAMNCWLRPRALELLAGVIAIDTRAAEVTVKLVLPVTPVPGCVAEMVVLPLETLVASPLLPSALLIVATLVAPEDHVTALVRSCTELSV
jgi:hypothetical protein